jgi:hypothetical protein
MPCRTRWVSISIIFVRQYKSSDAESYTSRDRPNLTFDQNLSELSDNNSFSLDTDREERSRQGGRYLPQEHATQRCFQPQVGYNKLDGKLSCDVAQKLFNGPFVKVEFAISHRLVRTDLGKRKEEKHRQLHKRRECHCEVIFDAEEQERRLRPRGKGIGKGKELARIEHGAQGGGEGVADKENGVDTAGAGRGTRPARGCLALLTSPYYWALDSQTQFISMRAIRSVVMSTDRLNRNREVAFPLKETLKWAWYTGPSLLFSLHTWSFSCSMMAAAGYARDTLLGGSGPYLNQL